MSELVTSDRVALRIAYLNIVQGIVARLANSSSVIKGASVTVLSAMLAFSATDGIDLRWWNFLPIGSVFMIYHAYFLQQERAFIRLYNKAAEKDICEDVSLVIDGRALREVRESYISVLTRPSIIGFHFPVILGFSAASYIGRIA
ncbi:hypothetical protein [Xanthomonas sp. BRIP62409]|uniref:hypothetical protein n=1 Tax=Xanthomonas sp. BRIP62409 TaxID=2182388 RepID=UPI000F8D518B|nr:hypothetical protein [Xanthomonas sp. BRIP62409]